MPTLCSLEVNNAILEQVKVADLILVKCFNFFCQKQKICKQT